MPDRGGHQRVRGARWRSSTTRPCARNPDELKKRLEDGEAIDDVLPEAFAVCREAARRTVAMRHFDVQLIGGMVLHCGQDRRDGDRRGQDARGHAARLPQRASPGAACTSSPSTTTWPSATRSGWGRSTDALGLSVGVIQHEASFLYDPAYVTSGHPADLAAAVHAAGGLPRRHHLRHQQRVRLRLPARQHALHARRAACSASSTTPSSTRWTRS